MSYDLVIWFPNEMLSDEQALEQYYKICNEDASGLIPHPSIGNFYLELYHIHPEIDDVPPVSREISILAPGVWSTTFQIVT